jgi:hypothetical protein
MAETGIATWIRKNLTREVVVAFLLGAVVGLVVLGWWLWPVEWTNADPNDLRDSHQASYFQTIADSYALTGDADLARARLESLRAPSETDSELAGKVNELVRARLDTGRAGEALRLQGLASAILESPPETPQPREDQPTSPTSNRLVRAVGIVFFLGLLAAGVLLLLSQMQKREAVRRRRAGLHVAPVEDAEESQPSVVAPPVEGTLAHFVSTYGLGDEGYDVSSSVHSVDGEFIGEFGISALEDLPMAEPGRVAAFEVWLFDKDDVRTETKLILSDLAFGDNSFRDRLVGKGEIVQAEPGEVITLETANLHLDATVTELAYESAAKSAFSRLTTRLEVRHA